MGNLIRDLRHGLAPCFVVLKPAIAEIGRSYILPGIYAVLRLISVPSTNRADSCRQVLIQGVTSQRTAPKGISGPSSTHRAGVYLASLLPVRP
jgi:hypothetical protein